MKLERNIIVLLRSLKNIYFKSTFKKSGAKIINFGSTFLKG